MMIRLTIISCLILGSLSTKIETDHLRFDRQIKSKVRQMQRFERERTPASPDVQYIFPKYYFVPQPIEIDL